MCVYRVSCLRDRDNAEVRVRAGLIRTSRFAIQAGINRGNLPVERAVAERSTEPPISQAHFECPTDPRR